MNLKEMFQDIDRTDLIEEVYANIKYLGLDDIERIVLYVDNHVNVIVIKEGDKNVVHISHAGKNMLTGVTSNLHKTRLASIWHDIVVLGVLTKWAYDVYHIKTMMETTNTPFVKPVKGGDNYLTPYFSLLIDALVAYGDTWRVGDGPTFKKLAPYMLSE